MKKLMVVIMAVLTLYIPGRVEIGTVEGRRYVDDMIITTLETADGNLWEVEDYTANLSAPCIIVFDDRGTDDLEDDRITYILTLEKLDG